MFETLLAQEQASRVMSQWVDHSRLPFACILLGPKKCGKFTAATLLARHILCTGDRTTTCQCNACKKMTHDTPCHPDYHLVEPQGKGNRINIDQVRELIEALNYVPQEADHKVAVIKSAHRLRPGSANALLKLLEEPLGNATIILTSSSRDAMLDTILSRTHLVRFSFLSKEAVRELMIRDGYGIDDVAIEIMGGTYDVGGIPSEFFILSKLFEGESPTHLDESQQKALRGELVYVGAAVQHMFRNGLVEFNGIKVLRLNIERVVKFLDMVMKAIRMYDRGVRPFLVLKFFENHFRLLRAG